MRDDHYAEAQAPRMELTFYDADCNPGADDSTTVRATVTSDGVVRSRINYCDADGNPTPQATATRSIATGYDAAGNVISSFSSSNPDDEDDLEDDLDDGEPS